MKIFEKIITYMMVSFADGKLDPLQFPYRTSKGVNDAKHFILNKVYKHLESHSPVQGFYLLTFCLLLIRCSPTFYLIALHLILSYPIDS